MAEHRIAPAWLLEERQGLGVMIALFVPPAVAEAIALPDGEAPESLHVTIAYLGRDLAPETIAAARAAAQEVAQATPPLVGRIGGVGRFSASPQSDGKDVIIVLPDLVGLDDLRARLLAELRKRSVVVKQGHGFIPHITLAYVEAGAPSPVATQEPIEVRFDAMSLAIGGAREHFPLRGDQVPRVVLPIIPAPAPRDDGGGFTSADLASGGLASPTQGSGGKPRKPKTPVLPVAANPTVKVVTIASKRREISTIEFRALRADPKNLVVYGVAYPAFTPETGRVYSLDELRGKVDSWATFMRPASVELLAHRYLEGARGVDKMHDNVTEAGTPVESHIARGDVAAALGVPDGSWMAAVRAAEECREDIENGTLRGFSIEVWAGRVEHSLKVKGKGIVPDLTDVTDPPFLPNRREVDGEATIRIDELVEPDPVFLSLVDRPATGYMWERRDDVRTGQPVVRFHREGRDDVVVTLAQRGSVKFEDTPAGGPDTWDGAAADKELQAWASSDGSGDKDKIDWAKLRRGYAWVDDSAAENFGSYHLAHHRIVDGKLVLSRQGLFTAAARRNQVTAMPAEDLARVETHLAGHYKALGMTAPWESEARADDPPPRWFTRWSDALMRMIGLRGGAAEAVRRLAEAPAPVDASHALAPPTIVAPLITRAAPALPRVAMPLFRRKDAPMSTAALQRANARATRMMTTDGKPIGFAEAWAIGEACDDAMEATWCLNDCLCTIFCSPGAYPSTQAMLQAIVDSLNAYVQAIAEIYAEMDEATIKARAPELRAALLGGAAIAIAAQAEVTRAGKTYSAATAKQIMAAYEALHPMIKAIVEEMAPEERAKVGKTLCMDPEHAQAATMAEARAAAAHALAEVRAMLAGAEKDRDEAMAQVATSAEQLEAEKAARASVEKDLVEARTAAEKAAADAKATLEATEKALAEARAQLADLSSRRGPVGGGTASDTVAGEAQGPVFAEIGKALRHFASRGDG